MSATTNSYKKIKKAIIVGSACHRPDPAASSPDPAPGEGSAERGRAGKGTPDPVSETAGKTRGVVDPRGRGKAGTHLPRIGGGLAPPPVSERERELAGGLSGF